MNKKNKYSHNEIGDTMKELLWDLFKTTGKIDYYLKYRKELDKNGKKN